MKGILIKKNGHAEVVEFKDELNDLYRLIDCDCIDIVIRKIGDSYYHIVCDDMGYWDDNPIVTAIDRNYRLVLVGNLLITNSNDEGELTGLSDEDISNIMESVISLKNRDILFEE